MSPVLESNNRVERLRCFSKFDCAETLEHFLGAMVLQLLSTEAKQEAHGYSTAQSYRGPLMFAVIRPIRRRQALTSQMLTHGCCLDAPQPVFILRRRSTLRTRVAHVPCCGSLPPYQCKSPSLTCNEAHTRISERLITTAQACNSTTAWGSLQQAHHQCNELQHGPHQPGESSTLQNATTDVQPSVRPGGFPVSQLLARSLLVAGMLMLTSHFVTIWQVKLADASGAALTLNAQVYAQFVANFLGTASCMLLSITVIAAIVRLCNMIMDSSAAERIFRWIFPPLVWILTPVHCPSTQQPDEQQQAAAACNSSEQLWDQQESSRVACEYAEFDAQLAAIVVSPADKENSTETGHLQH